MNKTIDINEIVRQTNINNIKYSNTLNTTSNVSLEESIIETNDLSSSFEVFREEVAFMPQDKLPPLWNGVKIDLFENGTEDKPKKTIKFTIIRTDDTRFACSAALNSPHKHVYRGRNHGQGTKAFWNAVEQRIEHHNQQGYDFSISKIGKPKKGGTIEDMATVVYNFNDAWHCELIKYHEIYRYKLDGIVQEGFRNKNGIATGFWGSIKRNWANQEELGI